MLITKAKMAKLAEVSRSAITKSCREGALKSALCGDKIDLRSEPARLYLREKGIDPDIGLQESTPVSNPHDSQFDFPDGKMDPMGFGNMTLNQICDTFGSGEKFKHWLSAQKILTEIQRNELANAKTAGDLVAKNLMGMVFDSIDSVFRTLLTDTSKTIGIRSKAMAESGSSADEIQKFVVDQISSVIRPGKTKAKRVLDNA